MDYEFVDNLTTIELDFNSTELPDLSDTCTEKYPKDCWPPWMNVAIPLLCVLVFSLTLLIVSIFPNRPPPVDKETELLESLTKYPEPVELNNIQRVKKSKKKKLKKEDDEIKSAMV